VDRVVNAVSGRLGLPSGRSGRFAGTARESAVHSSPVNTVASAGSCVVVTLRVVADEPGARERPGAEISGQAEALNHETAFHVSSMLPDTGAA
jgi:hypothetical protein